MILENKERREELQEKVNLAKDVIKQGECLRRHIEREGTYNLLQIEKARKEAQLLLGIAETKPDAQELLISVKSQ